MKVPLLNFAGGPGAPLLNFEGGPGVPLLNFREVLVPFLHHAVFNLSGSNQKIVLQFPVFRKRVLFSRKFVSKLKY